MIPSTLVFPNPRPSLADRLSFALTVAFWVGIFFWIMLLWTPSIADTVPTPTPAPVLFVVRLGSL